MSAYEEEAAERMDRDIRKYIGHESQLAGVEEYRLTGGKGDGMRIFSGVERQGNGIHGISGSLCRYFQTQIQRNQYGVFCTRRIRGSGIL